MKKPLVSIITPLYNSEEYISDTIESVISQTYENWELLICDDCSTDNSTSIIEKYVSKDPRIRLFHTERPSGSPVGPRNIAIMNAKGRHIAFLDSDDIWLPTKLEEQIPLLEKENVAVVFSYYEKIDRAGNRDNRIIKSPSSVSFYGLLKGNCIGNLTGIYDTDKVGKIYQRDIHHEDYALWLDILKNGHIAMNTNSVTALYRTGGQSISSNKAKAAIWTWKVLRKAGGLSFIKTFYYFSFYMFNALTKQVV